MSITFVIVLGVVPDDREDESAVTIEEQVPGSVGPASLQLDHPIVHGRP